MKPCLLTVIVPIYNVEQYLDKCLTSLVDYKISKQYQVLLVDDCGQDNSISIAYDYVKKYPEIFKIITHETNSGLSAARNTGLANTFTPYVMFVDSDDWVSNGIIKNLLQVIENSNPDFLFFDFSREWKFCSEDVLFLDNIEAPQLVTEDLYFSLLRNVPVTAWGKVFRTEIVKKFMFTEGIIFEDVAIIPLIMLKSKIKVYFPGVKYHYRQRENSIMSERRGERDSLFRAYGILLSVNDEVFDKEIYEDLIFILLKDWLINVRVALREEKYGKAIDLLDNGILFFNLRNKFWKKNKHLKSHLSSNSFLSKMKINLILSLIDIRVFKLLFLLHVNYQNISWNNFKPLIGVHISNKVKE